MNPTLVLLLEAKQEIVDELLQLLHEHELSSKEVSTENDVAGEVDNIMKEIETCNEDVLLVKFSGSEDTVSYIGDECSALVITLSANKNSVYYTKEIKDTFLNIIETL